MYLLSSLAAAAKLLQSCPTLCDPIDGSPPGSPALGFSRQEYWSGLPFPSPMHKSEIKSLSCARLLATPWTAAYQAPPSMGFSRQSTGVGCHCLLQRYCHTTVLIVFGLLFNIFCFVSFLVSSCQFSLSTVFIIKFYNSFSPLYFFAFNIL